MRSLLTLVFTLSLLQYSRSQTFNWAVKMEQANPACVFADVNGYVYTTGKFPGTVDFDPGPGVLNLSGGAASPYVQKLDASGNLVWARHMAGGINAEGFSVATDASANVYILGYFRGTVDFDPGVGIMNLSSTPPSFDDLFIQKLDVDGNLVWVKQVNINMSGTLPKLSIDSDGNVYSVGSFEGVTDFDPGAGDHSVSSGTNSAGFVLKLNTTGDFVWVNIFSTLSWANAVVTDGSHVYVAGSFLGTVALSSSTPSDSYTSKGLTDSFVLKLTTGGEFVWAKQIGGSGSDYGRALDLDDSGNVYLLGEFEQTCNFNIDGTPNNLTSDGAFDIFLQKFSPSGEVLWVKQVGGTGYQQARNISVNNEGNLFVAGSTNGTTTFKIGATPRTITGDDGGAFIVQVAPSLELGWLVQYPFGQLNMATVGNHVYATGRFTFPIDFDPGQGNYTLTPESGFGAFVMKLTHEAVPEEEDPEEEDPEEENPEEVTGIEELTQAGISVYPNPFNSTIFITKSTSATALVRVKDVHSRIVKEQIIEGGSESEIDVTNLSDGLYILEISGGDKKVAMTKLVKH